ncbi:hypothetical protein ACFVFT_35605 [Streptomyces tendae]|uniref:hypothetical protein n=1 Tax=Streptomyces tendae TaxID=1932 RepID=UPI003682873C
MTLLTARTGALEQAPAARPSPAASGTRVPATLSATVSSLPTTVQASTSAPGESKETEPKAPAAASDNSAQSPATCGGDLAPRWADWPMPVSGAGPGPRHASYTVLGGGAVQDDVTCLRWQPTPTAKTYTFANAAAYCTDLDLAGGGWRLPSRIN